MNELVWCVRNHHNLGYLGGDFRAAIVFAHTGILRIRKAADGKRIWISVAAARMCWVRDFWHVNVNFYTVDL